MAADDVDTAVGAVAEPGPVCSCGGAPYARKLVSASCRVIAVCVCAYVRAHRNGASVDGSNNLLRQGHSIGAGGRIGLQKQSKA